MPPTVPYVVQRSRSQADPNGQAYAFEKRVVKGGGGDGYADVWKRGFFAWEYKGMKADLKAATGPDRRR